MLALLVSIFLAFSSAFVMLLFVYWLDRYEKEPLGLLAAAFMWGVVIAAGGAFIINTVLGLGVYVFTGDEVMADVATVSLIAPFVEESLKGLALVIVFLFFRKEFDSILDGIIYAGMVALGFAATENVIYIFDRGYNELGWPGLVELAWIRLVVVAWQHPFYTAFTGIGLAIARMNRNFLVKIIAIPAGFATAVFAHFLHNTMAIFLVDWLGRVVDWFGWIMMGFFIVFMIARERALIRKHLFEEVKSGLISQAQYTKALSPWTMTTTSFSGRATSRFYQVCGELAHKKEQFAKVGNERDNLAIIEKYRAELAQLAPLAKA
jgi:RsiW-degrading membrane proteinase PrsW (M82 family)